MKIFEDFGCGVYAAPLELSCPHWGITDTMDICRLLGQLSVESGQFKRVEENLNYRPDRLLQIFRGRNGLITIRQAENICALGAMGVANFVYGGSWGQQHLGNTNEGDGWKFHGRGLIQLTGFRNYHEASWGAYGDGRLVKDPDMLLQPDVAANIACWYWYNRKCSSLTDIAAITKKVNGGLTALDERIAETKRAVSLAPAG